MLRKNFFFHEISIAFTISGFVIIFVTISVYITCFVVSEKLRYFDLDHLKAMN
jgi:hypothetical protein